MVLCRDPKGKHADIVFFDSDATSSPENVIARYAARWSIEITNREAKQLHGADEPRCRKEKSVMRAPMFAYWAYSLVVLWFVRQFSAAKDLVIDPAPWYRKKNFHLFRHACSCTKEPLLTELFSGKSTSRAPRATLNTLESRNYRKSPFLQYFRENNLSHISSRLC